MKKLNSTQTEK